MSANRFRPGPKPDRAATAAFAFVCLFALSAPASGAGEAEANRLDNGDFARLGPDGQTPDGWPRANAEVQYPDDSGRRVLRVVRAKPDAMNGAQRRVAVQPGDRAYALRFRVRYAGIVVGEKKWHDGRVIVNILDAEGKTIATPPPPYFKGTRMDWRESLVRFALPEGAAFVDLRFALFNAKAGVMEFADIGLEAIDPALVPPTARRIGDTVVAAPDPARLPPALRVRGNKIVTDAGDEVWLQGVSIASLEWSVGGDNVLRSVEVAIDDWKANCVRLPVKGTYWFGLMEGQTDGGAEYRRNVDSVVNKVVGRGAYLVLDLHRFRAVTEDDLAFWRDAAARYRDHPGVLFEIFNEPYDISWEVWRDGGTVTEKAKPRPDVARESSEMAETRFESPGTQKLVETIRETGATNILIAGALDFSYDLSGILKGHALADRPEGRGIVYSSHVYPWKRDWKEKFLDVAEKHPVFIGECGAPDKPMPFQDAATMPDPHAWSKDFLGMVRKHRLHWTGWCFHPRAGPKMLQDWNYNPTPYWGAYAKRALRGEVFDFNGLR